MKNKEKENEEHPNIGKKAAQVKLPRRVNYCIRVYMATVIVFVLPNPERMATE